MKLFACIILAVLVASAVAHRTNAVDRQSDDEKPITEASAETKSENATAATATFEKLPVKIYYEGLCPDSRKLMGDLGCFYIS